MDTIAHLARYRAFNPHLILGPLLILVVVIVGYGIAPARLPIVDEETRRMQLGIEMARTGDWVIARSQGVPFLDRPPGQYWTFALIHRYVHDLTPTTARVTMAIAVLLTALVTWWYARSMIGTVGALVAGLAYPTTAHVFDIGRRAETDGLFVLLMVSALFIWHHGYTHRKGLVRTWIVAAIIAALATYTKGLQGPVTFFGAIGLFLLIRRDWRTMLHWSGVFGLLVFLGIIAIWQVPLFQRVGWLGTRDTWFTPAIHRVSFEFMILAEHLATFPVKVFGAALPWSPLLIALFSRQFWDHLRDNARSTVIFCICGILVIITPVWVIAGGSHRYSVAAYPLMAVLVGAVVDRALWLDFSFGLRRFWYHFARTVAVALAVAMVGLIIATAVATQNDGKLWQISAQPWWVIALVAPTILVLAFVVYRRVGREADKPDLLPPFLLALMIAMFFNGPVLNSIITTRADPGAEITQLKRELPEGTRMISFGPAFHKFLYWWGEPIDLLPAEPTADDVPVWADYFVVTVYRGKVPPLPFEYETVAFLNMDRTKHEHPKDAVLVGRLIRREPRL